LTIAVELKSLDLDWKSLIGVSLPNNALLQRICTSMKTHWPLSEEREIQNE
jgi:hypothetical protein